MLLALIFILLLIWAAVVGSLYSNFIVFYKSFAEIDNYNKAYYASIAALERWELVTKQREPWYVWSGGWEWTNSINYLDNNTDEIESGFSYLVKSDDTNLLREINSKTKRIPTEWEWDIDRMLASWNSLNHNRMDHEKAEVFLLYVDDWEDSPYTKKMCLSWNSDCQDVKVTINWEIRLPPKMREAFWSLDDSSSSLVYYWNKNDEIVDRQLRWKYQGSQFTIFAKNKSSVSNDESDSSDSVIRESEINKGVTLKFWNSELNQWKRQPNVKKSTNLNPIIISSQEFKPDDFETVLNGNNNDYSRLNLRLSLLNLLKSESNMIYPYLEYYLNFTDYVADKYFRIDGWWRYKDYQVNIIIYKPTVKESVLWNFTVIF